jgi:pSer/pThr/pTyr-binding forkhead associated (FHA) protein
MAQFRFVMRSGPAVGQTYTLEGDEITIGRDTTNKIAINDSEISRKHARLIRQGEGYVLEDFGSTNGTFVNGQRLSGLIGLKVGDLVALGENIALVYEAQYDPDATMLSSSKRGKAAAPAPIPVSTPAPVYSGNIPASPIPIQIEPAAAPAKQSRKNLLLIIILALIVLCIGAVAIFLFFAPTTFWCSLPLINWGEGACP